MGAETLAAMSTAEKQKLGVDLPEIAGVVFNALAEPGPLSDRNSERVRKLSQKSSIIACRSVHFIYNFEHI